jgi:hypothetical protein
MWTNPLHHPQVDREAMLAWHVSGYDIFMLTAILEECMSLGIAPMYMCNDNINIALSKLPTDLARKMKRKFRKLWRKLCVERVRDYRRSKIRQKLLGRNVKRFSTVSEVVSMQRKLQDNNKPDHNTKSMRKFFMWSDILSRADLRAQQLRKNLSQTSKGGDVQMPS